MGKNQNKGSNVNLMRIFFFLCILYKCSSNEDQRVDHDHDHFYSADHSFTYSAQLKHYDWRYINVNLPDGFTSATIALESDVDLDLKRINSSHKSELPMICFRDGGPPLPDVPNTNTLNGLVLDHFFNGSLQEVGDCYPLQKNMKLTFTNDQILPGALYAGLFNGIGPIRTESKMINRGSTYSFTANIATKECKYASIRGQYCDQTIHQLWCTRSDMSNMPRSLVACKNHLQDSCQQDFEPKAYSLDVVEIAEKLVISANNIGRDYGNCSMGYARYGAVPKENLNDFAVNLSKESLVIQSPKVGKWYFLIAMSNMHEGTKERNFSSFYSLEWRVIGCPQGKAGPNCTWESHILQAYVREDWTVPVVYLPDHANMSEKSSNFPFEPLLSKTSEQGSNLSWTYFQVNIPQTLSGYNIHLQLLSDRKIDYELYVRLDGLPSLTNWDYYYSNQTSNSNNGSSMFKSYDLSDQKINIYLLYPKEGLWILGLRHPVYKDSPNPRTTMSISIESCPNQCSRHGTCRQFQSQYSRYCYCTCDTTHGGFDCSVELISPAEQRWHSISLIASNAAALLPALRSLRQKAFAELVIFICSGVSSSLYHACDVGTWCVLSFQPLQFMDFWLSFMAVVSTFIYLAVISEASKRSIQTVAWIVTALMAITGPTNSRNLSLVVVIGAVGLLVGWLIELFRAYKSSSLSLRSYLNILKRRENMKEWIDNLMKAVYVRFHWWFMLAGFLGLSMAAISWILETSQTYWIWHSTWHVSIYTSSFFFLCSKAAVLNGGENYRSVVVVVEDHNSTSAASV